MGAGASVTGKFSTKLCTFFSLIAENWNSQGIQLVAYPLEIANTPVVVTELHSQCASNSPVQRRVATPRRPERSALRLPGDAQA
jgi:hypothetical protein